MAREAVSGVVRRQIGLGPRGSWTNSVGRPQPPRLPAAALRPRSGCFLAPRFGPSAISWSTLGAAARGAAHRSISFVEARDRDRPRADASRRSFRGALARRARMLMRCRPTTASLRATRHALHRRRQHHRSWPPSRAIALLVDSCVRRCCRGRAPPRSPLEANPSRTESAGTPSGPGPGARHRRLSIRCPELDSAELPASRTPASAGGFAEAVAPPLGRRDPPISTSTIPTTCPRGRSPRGLLAREMGRSRWRPTILSLYALTLDTPDAGA